MNKHNATDWRHVHIGVYGTDADIQELAKICATVPAGAIVDCIRAARQHAKDKADREASKSRPARPEGT